MLDPNCTLLLVWSHLPVVANSMVGVFTTCTTTTCYNNFACLWQAQVQWELMLYSLRNRSMISIYLIPLESRWKVGATITRSLQRSRALGIFCKKHVVFATKFPIVHFLRSGTVTSTVIIKDIYFDSTTVLY